MNFFTLSKLIWPLFAPGTLVVILGTLLTIGLWTRFYKSARTFLSIGCLIVLIIAVTPVSHMVITPLESRFMTPALPETIDGIIMLGGAENQYYTRVWNQVELGDGAERYLAFVQLCHMFPSARKVYTGGSGSLTSQEFKGADVAVKLFAMLDMDTDSIIFETRSKNTWENARFSRKMLNPQPHEKWILVTSSYHMPRAVGVFQKNNWEVIPYPVDHKSTRGKGPWQLRFLGNFKRLEMGLHEWTGLLAYRLTQKIDRLFPGPADNLDRQKER